MAEGPLLVFEPPDTAFFWFAYPNEFLEGRAGSTGNVSGLGINNELSGKSLVGTVSGAGAIPRITGR